MSDLKAQVEELLALCEKDAPIVRYTTGLTISSAFPAIARAYLDMIDVQQRALRYGVWMEEKNEGLKAENAALREVAKTSRPFAVYAHVLEVLAIEDRQLGALGKHNGWDDMNPVLGARGQSLTMGDFRLLRDALSRADALTGEKP